MDIILGDLKMICVLVYLKNIIVFSCTLQYHPTYLQLVFTCRKAGLKLKPFKLSFFKNEMAISGIWVSQDV